MIYFTSDHHFGHANIIKYCNRPFRNVAEMDQEMIQRWNSVVNYADTVYHLGDFCLGNARMARTYFGRLNGYIKILSNPWHHDKCWLPPDGSNREFRTKSGHLVGLLPPLAVVTIKRQVIVLCHYPLAFWDRKHYDSWHLHGHSHGRHHGEGKILDVGVDSNRFYPISFAEIARMLGGN